VLTQLDKQGAQHLGHESTMRPT